MHRSSFHPVCMCCVVLRCVVLCCVVLYYVVLCCVVLCCVVVCFVVWSIFVVLYVSEQNQRNTGALQTLTRVTIAVPSSLSTTLTHSHASRCPKHLVACPFQKRTQTFASPFHISLHAYSITSLPPFSFQGPTHVCTFSSPSPHT